MGNGESTSGKSSADLNYNSGSTLCRPYSVPSLRKSFRKLDFSSLLSDRPSSQIIRKFCRKSRRNRSAHEHILCKHCFSVWPIPKSQAIFMPDFKLANSSLLSSFQVEKLVSKGAFGDVYQVLQKGKDEKLALKVLRKSKIICEGCINQVKNEVKIQLMCGHHPFIVTLVHYFQTKKNLILVSEFLPGGDLYDFCSMHGPLSEELTKIYISQVAIALDFLHNAGIIMRDLKPENILIDCNRYLKLTDFGLAKWLKYGEKTGTICGTIGYMAPEVMAGEEPYGHAADWWSLGVLTYFMLTLDIFGIDSIKKQDGSVFFDKGFEDSINPLVKSFPSGDNCLKCKYSIKDLSYEASDFLIRLLSRDPNTRLKSLIAVSRIPFFHGIDLEAIKRKELDVEVLYNRQLKVSNNKLSVENFSFVSQKNPYSPLF